MGWVRVMVRRGKRRGRPRSWLNEYDFFGKYKLLVPRPPKCICGAWNYRFGFWRNDVSARCDDCMAILIFRADRQYWMFLYPSIPIK